MKEQQFSVSQITQIARVMAISSKPLISFDEATLYMDCSKSFLYKLTAQKVLPYFKPSGKCIYFQREDIENWIKSNRVATEQELTDKAQHLASKKGGRL